MAPNPPRLRNGNPIKEKVCLYGGPDAGKTHQYFNIAKWHQRLGSDAKFYGINTDESYDVLLSNPEFEELDNMVFDYAYNMQDGYDLAMKYQKVLRPQDWLSVDLQDTFWDMAQDEYAQIRAKESGIKADNIGDLLMDNATTKYPIEGWDWQTPNMRYRKLVNNYILRGNGHRFVICGETDILQPTASMKEDEYKKKARKMFEPVGHAMAGEKREPFRWHTIIHVDGDLSEEKVVQKFTTVKEKHRGQRRYLGKPAKVGTRTMRRGEQIDDFFMEYFVKVAGWKIKDD